jgi:hypothetical protein
LHISYPIQNAQSENMPKKDISFSSRKFSPEAADGWAVAKKPIRLPKGIARCSVR